MENNINKKKEDVIFENTEKVMTKYDKKVLKRQIEEQKEKRNKRIFNISLIAVLIALVIGSISYVVVRYNNMYGEYIKVGDNTVTKVEYDYYYNNVANNFLTSYSDYLTYFGLDTTKDFADQMYSEDLTWDDYFAQGAIESIKQTKALTVEAKEKEFKYDVTDSYNSYIDSIKKGATTNSISIKKYYKDTFGKYATAGNLKSVMKEYLMAGAYYDQLSELNSPSDSEVATYYAENKDKYDSIDYRVLAVATQEEADKMLSQVTDGTSFGNLAKTYAIETEKEKYQTSDASLIQAATPSSISSVYSAWLYDSSRKEGDKTVLADTENNQFFVVYFIKKFYDEANNKTIATTLTTNKVTEYIKPLTDKYTVTDKNHHLKYLTIETEAASE